MTLDHEDVQETVAELIEGYLTRMPGARELHLTDAEAHHTIGMVRHTLYLIEIAMHDEGVPEAIRRRVMRTVLYANAPIVADGQARVARLQERVAEVEKRAPMAVRIDDLLANIDALLDDGRGKTSAWFS